MGDHSAINHHARNATQHGFITMHPNDQGLIAQIRVGVTAQRKPIEAANRVDLGPAKTNDGLIVQYVEDTARRSMDDFHLVLGAIAATYWATVTDPSGARYFAWVHWL